MIKETTINFNDMVFKIQSSPMSFDGATKTVTLCEGKVTETTGFNDCKDVYFDLIEGIMVEQWGASVTGIYFLKVN